MAQTRQIVTPEQAAKLASYIAGLPLPLTVTIREGLIRTNHQNDLLWKWNEEVARNLGDRTADEVHRENKLRIGCRIRMRDEAFRAFVEKLGGLTYEEKLEAMDIIPVTSAFTKKEMQEYLDTVFRVWSERGVRLTVPEDAV